MIVEIEFPESGGFFLKGEFWEPLHILAGYRIWCGVRPRDESDFVNGAGAEGNKFSARFTELRWNMHTVSPSAATSATRRIADGIYQD